MHQQTAKLFQIHRRHLNSAIENTDKLLEQKRTGSHVNNISIHLVRQSLQYLKLIFYISYSRVRATWFILRKCPAAFLFPSPRHVISLWISTSRCVCVQTLENRQGTCMNFLNNRLRSSFKYKFAMFLISYISYLVANIT